MVYEFNLKTAREGMYNITDKVKEAVLQSKVKNGIAIVHSPHTTSGITINENADPDVQHDMLIGLDAAFPDRRNFLHAEGNSTAHLKGSTVTCQQVVIIEDGELLLGVWQGVYFCEFDGPRHRRFYVKIMSDQA